MSLRHFHIFFIILALAVTAFLAAWSGMRGFPVLCAVGAAGLTLGLPYLYWFLGQPAPNA